MDLDERNVDPQITELAALYEPAVNEALQEDDESARTEILLTALIAAFVVVFTESGGSEDDGRSYALRFVADMRDAVEMTVPKRNDDGSIDTAQANRIAGWFATATLGASAVATADSRGGEATKTWVTRLDEDVRSSHAQLHGETKAMSETFTVKSEPSVEMEYPGQPVGPPEAWINCRCLLTIDMNPTVASLTAAGGFSGVVIVALPEGDRTVTYEDGDTTELHQTIAYLGTTDQLQDGDAEAMIELAGQLATAMEGPFDATVAGVGTLGPDQDGIAITEAVELSALHDLVLAHEVVGNIYAERNTHPAWISHITNNGEFAHGDTIRFDRIGVWFGGDNHNTFEMGTTVTDDENMPDDEMEPPIPDEPIPAEDGNIPVYGIAVPEGVVSGDNRRFLPGSITHRPLPLPLTWQRAATSEHNGEVVVGRLDTLELRDDGMWHYTGELLADIPETEEVILLLAERALKGVSIGADRGVPALMTEEEAQAALDAGEPIIEDYAEARISNLAIVQIPAFAEAFIALGVEGDEEVPMAASAEVESFKRGTGWITHPEETSRLHRYWTRGPGAAKIAWGTNGDFTRCTRQLRKYIEPRFLNRTCAQWHHDALGYWPGERGKPGNPPKTSLEECTDCEDQAMIAASTDTLPTPQALTLTAAGAPPADVPADYMKDPKFTGPTPFQIERVGKFVRLTGHIATWGVCHIGIDKKCVTAPKSQTNYAHFHLGSIDTTEGPMSCGSLTLGTGHADLNLTASDTRHHYDHTGTAVVKCRAGEDEHGIWVAGVFCEGVTDEQIRTLAASGGASGDWRNIGGNLELVAALVVNVPGFPVMRPALAASASQDLALVAAGAVVPDEDETIDLIAAAVVARLDDRDKRAAKLAELEPVMSAARERRVKNLLSI